MGTPVEEKLYTRQAAHATSYHRVTLLANLFNSLILVYVLREAIPRWQLAVWFAVLAVILLARTLHSRFMHFETFSQAKKAARAYYAGLALTGLAWGFTPIFMFPEHPLQQTIVAFVIGGMVVGASVTSAALDYTFLVFSIPALAPLAVRFFALGSETAAAMGLMLIVFFFSMAYISNRLQMIIIQTFRSALDLEKEIDARKKVEAELRLHKEDLEKLVREKTRALSESLERFRQITETISSVFWISSPDWQELFYVSPAFEEIWGRSCRSVYENPVSWLEAVHPEDRDTIISAMGNRADGSNLGPNILEFRILRPDGSTRWILSRSYPVLDDRGRLLNLTGIAEDITQRKQVEADLQASKDLQDTLLDNLPVVALILEKKTRKIVACNKLARDMGAEIGRTCHDSVIGCGQVCDFCQAPGLWETGKPHHIEAEFRGRYWEGRWVHFTDELFIHYIVDITERKQAEQELIRHHSRLEELVRERTENLQTLVNAMAGREVRMAELKKLNEQLRRQLEEAGLTPAAQDSLNNIKLQ